MVRAWSPGRNVLLATPNPVVSAESMVSGWSMVLQLALMSRATAPESVMVNCARRP
jgi:hypothetical protein